MGKLTKKNLEKYLKGVYKKKNKKKKFGKRIEEVVRSLAIKEIAARGEDGMDKIVISNVSIEIWSDDPSDLASSTENAMRASAANPASAKTTNAASSNCFYYCYVIGGRRICQKICW